MDLRWNESLYPHHPVQRLLNGTVDPWPGSPCRPGEHRWWFNSDQKAARDMVAAPEQSAFPLPSRLLTADHGCRVYAVVAGSGLPRVPQPWEVAGIHSPGFCRSQSYRLNTLGCPFRAAFLLCGLEVAIAFFLLPKPDPLPQLNEEHWISNSYTDKNKFPSFPKSIMNLGGQIPNCSWRVREGTPHAMCSSPAIRSTKPARRISCGSRRIHPAGQRSASAPRIFRGRLYGRIHFAHRPGDVRAAGEADPLTP
jgi:hypothetical protein